MSGEMKNKFVCRLAGLEDLEPALEAVYQYNDEELLAKTLGSDLRNSESLRASVLSVIGDGGLLVAVKADSPTEVVGIAIYYEKEGLQLKEQAGVNQIEEYSIATATELGMEDQASAFSICNECLDIGALAGQSFYYLEALGVNPVARGCGVGTLLVQEFERQMTVKGIKTVMAVASSPGTDKILTRLGWRITKKLDPATFTFRDTRPFSTITDYQLSAYRKDL